MTLTFCATNLPRLATVYLDQRVSFALLSPSSIMQYSWPWEQQFVPVVGILCCYYRFQAFFSYLYSGSVEHAFMKHEGITESQRSTENWTAGTVANHSKLIVLGNQQQKEFDMQVD